MTPPFVRIQDVADILIMTFLVYQLYSWFYRTRAMQVLLGLGVVTTIYFVTRFLGLYMTSWVLEELSTVLIVVLIVVFQAEIRQTLYRFSLLRHLFERRAESKTCHFQEIAETIFSLASKRTGALLVFERNEPLSDLMLHGVKLDCEVTPQILETIFMNGTPLHDGATLVKEGRIAVASCHLPLSINADLPQHLGTRHRAALGLTERTDAIVVVVSEERGTVSLSVGSELRPCETPATLIAALDQLLNPDQEQKNRLPRFHLFGNLLPKTAIMLIVTIFWALISSRQGHIITVTVPVRLHGIPERLALIHSSPEEIDVQLKSFSTLTLLPSKLDLVADLDLSGIREGQTSVRVKSSDLKLPSGVEMTAVTPPSIKVVTDRKLRKRVPVKVALRGRLLRGTRGTDVTVEPAWVDVVGPASQIGKIETVSTEEIDATHLQKDIEYRKNLLPPENNITILREEPVGIRLVARRKKE